MELAFKKWKLLTGNRHETYHPGRDYYFVEEEESVEHAKASTPTPSLFFNSILKR